MTRADAYPFSEWHQAVRIELEYMQMSDTIELHVWRQLYNNNHTPIDAIQISERVARELMGAH